MSESTDPIINLDDDVEGHGLKEVAAGLSTAGILVASAAGVAHAAGGGGTGVTVQAAGTTISAQVATPTVTTPTVSVPDVVVPTVTTPHVTTPHVNLPKVSAPEVKVNVQPAVDQVINTVHASEHALHDDVVAAKATVANVERAAVTTVKDTRAAAATTVARTETLVQTTLRAEVTHIGDAYTAVVHVVNGDKGTSVSTHQASGAITLTSAGQPITNANVLNGVATLHWSGQHGTMALTFGGDSNHSSATISI